MLILSAFLKGISLMQGGFKVSGSETPVVFKKDYSYRYFCSVFLDPNSRQTVTLREGEHKVRIGEKIVGFVGKRRIRTYTYLLSSGFNDMGSEEVSSGEHRVTRRALGSSRIGRGSLMDQQTYNGFLGKKGKFSRPGDLIKMLL